MGANGRRDEKNLDQKDIRVYVYGVSIRERALGDGRPVTKGKEVTSMIRNLKVLGLAMVAILAMSAMVATAASAQGKLTSDGPVTLDGVEAGAASENALTSFGGETRCPGSTYTGHEVGSTTKLVPSGSTAVTLTPHYNQPNCVSVSGGSSFSSTVDMNSCDYVLDLGATSGAGYAVTATVVCKNVGDHILVTQFSSDSHAFRVCSVTVGPQSVTGAVASNGTGGHINLKGTFTGVDATRSGLCGASTTETGEFHINATVSGTNAEKGATAVSLSD